MLGQKSKKQRLSWFADEGEEKVSQVDGWFLAFGRLNFQLCRAKEEEKEEEGEEEKDVVVEEEEEGEEGCSQRSSNGPMVALVDPEIHKNLRNGRDKI